MNTDCTGQSWFFQPLNGNKKNRQREVRAAFDGGDITSDAGALLLREADHRFGIIRRFAACFRDLRNPELIEHTVTELLSQRIYGLALGYEDLNDHDDLRYDPLLATLCDKADPVGKNRLQKRDKGKPLAGKSTLNRFELPRTNETGRYRKIIADIQAIDRTFVDIFLSAHQKAPKRIVLDLDATDDPLHGKQEGKFFHGYYKCHCYLPLYIFCGDFLLCSRLRTADRDGADGSLEEVERIVRQIRERWPRVEIALRGDSGFCREALMSWCEENRVHYVFGLARNTRLEGMINKQMKKAARRYKETGEAARVYRDFRYRTRKSWGRKRRVIGKAEYLKKGRNPRFVVTSYTKNIYDGKTLYEKEYCARGDMENRIKEQQLWLFADRTSTHELVSNQLRLYLSSMGYCLMETLRRVGLRGTRLARAQCNTIRTRLLKIGAWVGVSVRRVVVSFCSSYPYKDVFAAVYENLARAAPV